jgi:tetratricopeptide (TPR) repeat protein
MTLSDLRQLTRLRRHPGPAARSLTRTLLDQPGIDDMLTQGLADSALRATVLDVVRHKLQRAVDAGEPWPSEAARWLHLAEADWATSAAFCNPLTWYARARRNSATSHLPGPLGQADPGPDDSYVLALRHLQLVALRYDFRCRSMRRLLNQVPGGQRAHWDPYTRSLDAFALLAQSDPAGLAAAQSSLDEAGDNPKVCHALLHGLWLGTDLPEQAHHILRLTERPVFDRGDPIMLLRRATALRTLGRHREALAAIDDAVEGLDPDASEVHADLIRERVLITQPGLLRQPPPVS